MAFGLVLHDATERVYFDDALAHLDHEVAGVSAQTAEANGGNQVQQSAKFVNRKLGPAVALVQNALELGFFDSISASASSMRLPISACLACARRLSQRAASGTQNTFTSR